MHNSPPLFFLQRQMPPKRRPSGEGGESGKPKKAKKERATEESIFDVNTYIDRVEVINADQLRIDKERKYGQVLALPLPAFALA